MGKYAERGRNPPHAIMPGDPPAIALIKKDHQVFRELFDRIEEKNGPEMVTLAGEACLRVTIHMILEEDVLYPALRPAIDLEKIDEGIVEHGQAKQLIIDIVHMTGREELYKSKVHVLGEEVMHHIDEEDRGLLRDARTAWEKGKIDLIEIGQLLGRRCQELYDGISAMGRGGSQLEIEPVGEAIDEFAGAAPPTGRG